MRVHPGRNQRGRHPDVRPVVPGDALLDDRNQFVVGCFTATNRHVKPSVNARAHQFLGIRQRDVMHPDGDIVLVRLLDNRSIENRRQRRLGSGSVVHPDLDEFRLHADIVLNGRSSLLHCGDRIRHVHSGGVALGSRSGPGDPRARRAKQRRIGNDLFPHLQRHVSPIRPAAMHIGTVFQIADADGPADTVVGEALQVVDQILAREEFLGHGSFRDVLEPEVAVKIDDRRHDRLARQIDVHGPGWNPQLTSPPDTSEQVVLHKERGVFDGRAAVAGNETRSFEYRHAGLPRLPGYPR